MGPAGAAGIRGPQGIQGLQGPTGPDGLAATIKVENSTRIPFDDNPYVVNVGTPQAAILRFGIPAGMPGEQGEKGDTGEAGKSAYQIALDNGYIGTETEWLDSLKGEKGPVASMIPFSISKYGMSISTDEHGEPSMVAFSGFTPSYYSATYLQEGEWSTGIITMREDMQYPTPFIMTSNGILRKIYVIFAASSQIAFTEGAVIQPFICLAISDSNDSVYRMIPETTVYLPPYSGGIEYPQNTTRKGSLTNLNVNIPEGALVALVAGIKGEGVTVGQSAMFSISGGLYLE